MERRFYIMEATAYAEGAPTITESELKRRLNIINGIVGPEDEWLEILLHGEKEPAEPPMQDPEKQREWLNSLDKPWPGPDDIIKMRGKEQPCPYCKVVHKDTDTCMGYPEQPDLREAWIQRMPMDMIAGNWFEEMKQWFREEPR